MKHFTLLLILLFCHLAQAQFQRFGLAGDTVYSLRLYGAKVYAGTQRGAFVHDIYAKDSSWTAIGLQGKRIRAIYPHSYGPIGYAVTAGIEHPPGDPDSALTYCTFYSDTSWAPTDTGMDRARFRYIGSADGFPSPAICGETFAATATTLYRRGGPVWESVLDMGIAKLNVVRTRVTTLTTGVVFVGGETAIFAPFIKYSADKGQTWGDATIPYHGDDACYAFGMYPADTSMMYAGMEGSVLTSSNGGRNWVTSGLSGTSFYFLALAVDNASVFAGGTANAGAGRFGLYRSVNRGANWVPVSVTDSLGGVLALEMIPTMLPELNVLLVGTMGSGVLLYTPAPLSVMQQPHPAIFELRQSYPNPFNPRTVIPYSIGGSRAQGPGGSNVALIVYDVLGRTVAVLVNEPLAPGQYEATFDGSHFTSGVYFYRLTAGNFAQTRKFLLLK